MRIQCGNDQVQPPDEEENRFGVKGDPDVDYHGCVDALCKDAFRAVDYTTCALSECGWMMPSGAADEMVATSVEPIQASKRLATTAKSLARLMMEQTAKKRHPDDDNRVPQNPAFADTTDFFSDGTLFDAEPTSFPHKQPNDHSGLRNGYGLSYENECIHTMCLSLSGQSALACIKHCIQLQHNQHPATQEHAVQQPPSNKQKRIINDETSQCIQSYCGGKQNRERLRCIVLSCHRA